MRIVCLSDTHMRHRRVALPRADVVIHAGDFTQRGTEAEVVSFLAWFGATTAAVRVLVAGNHDRFCERQPAAMAQLAKQHDVTYLCDAGVDHDGIRFWGSPATPRFRNMAFNRERGEDIDRHWQAIPEDIDVLVTHGPPHGAGDRVFFGRRVGCKNLRRVLHQRQPRHHVFGHIHEAGGTFALPDLATRLHNVASFAPLTSRPRAPVTFELP